MKKITITRTSLNENREWVSTTKTIEVEDEVAERLRNKFKEMNKEKENRIKNIRN